MASNDNKVFLDVTGLNSIGIIEVAKVGGETGVTYRGVGTQPPNMTKAMLLAEGNVAVVGSNGLISEINTADPGGRSAKGDPYRAWMLTAGYWWWVPVLVVVFIVSLLVFASRTRRRRVAEKVQR